LVFTQTRLPEIVETESASSQREDQRPLFRHTHFVAAIAAQFFYVAAQVGIAALFINYCTESEIGIDNSRASYLLALSLLLFTVGRFAGTALMKIVAPNKLLACFAVANVLLCVLVMMKLNWISVYSLMAIFFFESIMFPTIFALGIKNLGHLTKRGSSFLIMSIVGGASIPYLMGIIADRNNTAFAYIVPAFCFIVIGWYGWRGYKIRSSAMKGLLK
jgi:MFS transporter, FHS family, L-fucose permease